MDTFTRRANPTAASHAANTRMVIGMGIEFIELELRVVMEIMINRDSIIPSKHRRVDIRCERNIRVPNRDMM